MKYFNFITELFLIVVLAQWLGFTFNPQNTISWTNDAGERIVNDGVTRTALAVILGLPYLFVSYCLVIDVIDELGD
ncbi:hypothetical protein [Nostoc linckia]|uniref:hypothetical protein n=1 Tax=Nostoc linckia TaxID=92942 RepID=UPI00117F6D27|nr:hypothetical protein [Nostoc linckia]